MKIAICGRIDSGMNDATISQPINMSIGVIINRSTEKVKIMLRDGTTDDPNRFRLL